MCPSLTFKCKQLSNSGHSPGARRLPRILGLPHGCLVNPFKEAVYAPEPPDCSAVCRTSGQSPGHLGRFAATLGECRWRFVRVGEYLGGRIETGGCRYDRSEERRV